MAPSAPRLKQTYRPRAKLEVFYTGGPVRLTPDGGQAACACGEETKIVDVGSGTVVKTCPGDGEPITSIALTPDGMVMFTASRSLTVRKWDLCEGDCLRAWRAHKAPVAEMIVDSTGSVLATGSADRSVRVWDVEGGFATHAFTGHSDVVLKLLFHSSKLLLFSGGADSEIRVWNLETKRCAAVLKGHYSAVTSLCLSPSGSLLLSGGRDKVVNVWDFSKKCKVATVPVFEAVEGMVALPQTILSSLVPPSGKDCVFFVTAGDRGTAKMWRSDTGKPLCEQKRLPGTHQAGELMDLMLWGTNRGLVTASADCCLSFLEMKDNGNKPELVQDRLLVGNNDEITDLCWIGPTEEPTHVVMASNTEHIHTFDAKTLNCSATMAGHTGTVLCLAVRQLQDGRGLVVSGSKDHSIRIWDAQIGVCLAVGEGHSDAVTAVAFSHRAGGFIVSVSADRLLKVWDIAPVLQLPSRICDEAPSPLKLKVSAGMVAHAKDINTVAVAPNNAVVCSGSQDKTAKLFKLPNLIPSRTLTGHTRGVWDVQFSPVDRVVATASNDKTIKLWSLTDGACLKTLEGHAAAVLQLEFMSYGTQIMSCGADGLVKLWNIASAECVNTFDSHEDKIWALAVAGQDQHLMVTGGSDSVLVIWSDTTAEDEKMAAAEHHLEVQKEQQLVNALKAADYKSAGKLAFELKHPGRLLSVLNSTCSGGKQQQVFGDLLKGMTAESLKTCLEYIRHWNTNAKHCHEAQCLLRAVMEEFSPQDLLAIAGIGELLEGIYAYTDRHFARIDRLMKGTFLVDYTLAAMNILLPETECQEATETDVVLESGGNHPRDCAIDTLKTGAIEGQISSKGAKPKLGSFVQDDLDVGDGHASDPASPSPDSEGGNGSPDENSVVVSERGVAASIRQRMGKKRKALAEGQMKRVSEDVEEPSTGKSIKGGMPKKRRKQSLGPDRKAARRGKPPSRLGSGRKLQQKKGKR